MQNFSKMFGCLASLAGTEAVVQTAERVEIKRGRTGSHRVFIAVTPGTPDSAFEGVRTAVQGKEITANPFFKAGRLVTITLVDDKEDEQQ